MPLSYLRHCCWSLDAMSAGDVQSLLAAARSLKRGGPHDGLHGCHAALLCEAPGPSAELFAAACRGLGATVAHVSPSLSRLGEQPHAAEVARLLGRLYAAIGCDGLAPWLMQALARDAGVPVFNPVAGATHPTRLVATLLTMAEEGGRDAAETRLCVAAGAPPALLAAWRRCAELTGLELRGGAPAHGDFLLEAPRQPSRPPRLARVDGPGRPRLLAAQESANHGLVVQALLAHTVG